jgi:3-phenylpropionate/trans-cinnamate dioxygenase ferredoxin subunit
MADDFVRACAVGEVPPGEAVGVEVNGEPVAVVHTEDDQFFAIRDVCSHAEVPLSEGDVEGCTIECWLHGSQFDLRTGKPTGLPATEAVPTYETRISDGDVYVSVQTATQEPVK